MWLRFWSAARYDLHLSNAEFFALTPRQFDALLERHKTRAEHDEFMLAQLTSWIANTGFRTTEKPTTAKDFMPSAWGKRSSSATASAPLTREQHTELANRVRDAFRPLTLFKSCPPTESKIKGLTELKAKLEALSTKQADRCIRTALKAGAAIEQAAIEERAPVKDTTGGSLPDGALKADIGVSIRRDSADNQFAVVGPGKLTRHVALWVEYGHRIVRGGRSRVLANGKTRGPGKAVGAVEAHPFIRTAYEETRDAVATEIASTLASEVEKAARKKGTD